MWIKGPVSVAVFSRYCPAVAEEGSGMAGAGAASLPDKIALGVLTRLITREVVEEVLAGTGRREQREKAPARPGRGVFRARAGLVLRRLVRGGHAEAGAGPFLAFEDLPSIDRFPPGRFGQITLKSPAVTIHYHLR